VSRHQIADRLRSGRLHEIHRGVYLVGHTAPPPLAVEQAALLTYRNAATLSHRTAANLWKLLPYPATAPAWVTLAPEQNATRPGIRIRRAKLSRQDIRHRHGLRLTSPPRTILDLAALLREGELEQLVAEAHYRRLASDAELCDQLARNPGRRGSSKLRRILGIPGGPKRTRSPAEVEMLRLLRNGGFTGFEANTRVHGYEVDFYWPDAELVVEIDGYDAHSGRLAFERDRVKHATLIAKGLRVVPITGRRVRHEPERVLSDVAAALARGRAA
jgi:very-short-patch-repair endonuclease